jgi:hypothetical protein
VRVVFTAYEQYHMPILQNRDYGIDAY